ncbi:hypothetical protein I4F81_006965 [Pyropia yezoensis]|uniref:Uncharacterized protein n=1 Tax=Pyropia yezoensis TaxID=2788 RepID=A0ACC3C3M8_PYRYE|nr:hypothetical protein I4F81_006965 [Neopyropia yezoensis]
MTSDGEAVGRQQRPSLRPCLSPSMEVLVICFTCHAEGGHPSAPPPVLTRASISRLREHTAGGEKGGEGGGGARGGARHTPGVVLAGEKPGPVGRGPREHAMAGVGGSAQLSRPRHE